MNRLLPLLLPLAALVLSACGAAFDVVRMPDGQLRASSPNEAAAYCASQRQRARMLGPAPGNIDLLFRCVSD